MQGYPTFADDLNDSDLKSDFTPQELLRFSKQCVTSKSLDGEPKALLGVNALSENKFSFVKRIQKRIQGLLDPVVAHDLEMAATQGVEHIIPYLEDKILSSAEYNELVAQVTEDLKKSAAQVMQNLEHSPVGN